MHYLEKISTRAPKHFSKTKIKAETEKLLGKIAERQKVLFAQKKFSLLIILQGLDASGKDGLIGKVFTGLNPLGVSVKAFKQPTPEEAAHDFLWRVHAHAPEKGMISIFNRSHYEDVLVPRVNGDISTDKMTQRMRDINHFEQLLEHHDTVVLKFYLHISREEQLDRLRERKTNPEKFWKHNDGDWETRRKWDKYVDVYQEIFQHCNHPEWHIIPADQNWHKEYLVSKKVYETLKKLDLSYPGPPKD